MKTISKMSPYEAYEWGLKQGACKERNRIMCRFMEIMSNRLNPVIWGYRGLNHAHWRLWRRSLRSMGTLRMKLQEFRDHLNDGCEEGKAAAHDLTQILNAKY